MGHTGGMTWRMVTPPKVRQMQFVLLSISLTWGASYLMPPNKRIPFSEVFPEKLATASLLPMWGWGAIMVCAATIGIIAEAALRNDPVKHRRAMWTSAATHNVLFVVYGTLAIAALATAVTEIDWSWPAVLPNVVSAVSRTFLWGGISFLHHLFANQPKPQREEPTDDGV